MKTSDMIKELCNKKNISVSELARRIGQTPQNFGKKLKRDTVTLEELKQIADVMEVTFEQSFIFPDGEQIKTSNEQAVSSMDTVDLIIKSSTEFYNDLKGDENGRYRSWEHCYSHFIKARGSQEIDYDYLSLQLAFYLASWGMYRGSSFLLQKDYKVHIPVVKELLSEKYDVLAGIE